MNKKKTSGRKSNPEKQQPGSEDKKRQRKKQHLSSKTPSSTSKNNSTLVPPDKHIHFEHKCKLCHKIDTLEGSSNLPRDTSNCGQHGNITSVSIKDVGLDIAGFLIEEEIRQNKQKLKLEIIRQIALSRELDKHLERQRHIMNNYICNNALNGTNNGPPSHYGNQLIGKCKCMVCHEVAMGNVSASTSTCVGKCGVSEKSLQVNRTDSISCKTISGSTSHGFENKFAQSTPLTKDVSCQGRKFSYTFQQSNEPNENEQTNVSRNAENCSTQCIEGFIDDYSCTLNGNKADCCDVSTEPDTGAADKQNEATTEMSDQTLNNLNNILKTPLNTIKPETNYQPNVGGDATEMILSNIKSIIQDYMENINLNCNKCNLEPSTSRDEKKLTRSNSNEDTNMSAKKSDMSTKCENDGTHIDIVMQFCESNNKKRAILEIEPCFDERKCMKYTTKKKGSKKKVCGDTDDVSSQRSLSSCSLSQCSNASRKFSPYPLRDRTSFRKSSKPNVTCRSHRQTDNYCRQKKCEGMKARKKSSNFSTCCSSNHSVEIIKVNRGSKKPAVCESSNSDSSKGRKKERKCILKKSGRKKQSKKGLTFCRKKSTICTYISNLGGYSIEQSKQTGKNSRECSLVPVRNHEHKSNRKLDHRPHTSKVEYSLKPFHETTRKDKKRRTPESICSLESSNLDDTSYREIKMSSRKGSNTCTTISLSLDDSNLDMLGKYSAKKQKEACPSHIIPISEQWFVNRFQDKAETSNRHGDTNILKKTTKQQRRKSVTGTKNVAFDSCVLHTSSSSDPSIYKSTTIQKLRNKFKTEIGFRLEAGESDSSVNETQPIENIKHHTKINSEGGRIQQINNWLSFIHKLQTKENIKATPPPSVSINLPTSSNYVLPSEESDQQFDYLLEPTSVLSNQSVDKNDTNKLKGRALEKCNKKSTAESYTNDIKKTVFQVRNSSGWSIFKKDKKETAIEKPIKRTTFKQCNKSIGLDCNKSKSEVLHTESSSSSEYIVGSSLSDSSFETTSESILEMNEKSHDELIQELICPNRNSFKGKYFDVGETDRIINRAFYIQDIFVNLASTDEEKEYWRDTVLRAMKNIVTKTS